MIFHEIYSAYYNTVAKIISSILDGKSDERELSEIVSKYAFGESVITLLPSLKSEKWQIVRSDFTTPIKHKPTMPLTLIQKQWLKAISLDSRIKLFGAELNFLDGIEPLFTPDDYFIYDRYSDGDPYDNEQYIKNYKTILYAIKNKKHIKFNMFDRNGHEIHSICFPERLEYSEKDDKFRLITKVGKFSTLNLARINKCEICTDSKGVTNVGTLKKSYEVITLKVNEERNTLERCLMHFAHFEKRVEKSGSHYLLHLRYDIDDEAELVIRVLSFGPTVEVIESEHFKGLIIEKLKKQKSCGL